MEKVMTKSQNFPTLKETLFHVSISSEIYQLNWVPKNHYEEMELSFEYQWSLNIQFNYP